MMLIHEEWNFEDLKEVWSKEICGSCDGFLMVSIGFFWGTKLDVQMYRPTTREV